MTQATVTMVIPSMRARRKPSVIMSRTALMSPMNRSMILPVDAFLKNGIDKDWRCR